MEAPERIHLLVVECDDGKLYPYQCEGPTLDTGPGRTMRVDWGKFGKAMLILAGIFAALFVPVLLLYSDIPAVRNIGTVLSVLEIVVCVAYYSGALEFNKKGDSR